MYNKKVEGEALAQVLPQRNPPNIDGSDTPIRQVFDTFSIWDDTVDMEEYLPGNKSSNEEKAVVTMD